MSKTLKVDDGWLIVDGEGRRLLGAIVEPEWEELTIEEWRTRCGLSGDEQPVNIIAPGRTRRVKLHDREALCPVFELQAMQVPQGNQLAFAMSAAPFGLFGHSRPFEVSTSGVLRVGDLHEDDRRMVVEWVVIGEDLKTKLRASRAGLVTPNGKTTAAAVSR